MSEHFAILNPCQKRWSDLSGDGRKRFCDECKSFVHALDQYSSAEIDDLRWNSSGRVCGFLTGESVPQPRSRRAVLVGALFTAVSPLLAQSGRVRVRVTDVSGAVIPGAQVSLLGKDRKPRRSLQTNENGETIFTDLRKGNSHFVVSRPGFDSLPLTVTVQTPDELRVDAKLEVSIMGSFRPKRRWWHIFR